LLFFVLTHFTTFRRGILRKGSDSYKKLLNYNELWNLTCGDRRRRSSRPARWLLKSYHNAQAIQVPWEKTLPWLSEPSHLPEFCNRLASDSYRLQWRKVYASRAGHALTILWTYTSLRWRIQIIPGAASTPAATFLTRYTVTAYRTFPILVRHAPEDSRSYFRPHSLPWMQRTAKGFWKYRRLFGPCLHTRRIRSTWLKTLGLSWTTPVQLVNRLERRRPLLI